MEILKRQLVLNQKEELVMAYDILRDIDFFLLYFSASWCPPCQIFLDQLKRAYELGKAQKQSFEIFFVTSDQDNKALTRVFMEKHGPWYALSNGPAAKELRRTFNVYAIPKVVVLTSDDGLISTRGREDIEDNPDPFAVWFPKDTISATVQDEIVKEESDDETPQGKEIQRRCFMASSLDSLLS
ncbi:tryparedoxin-like [Prorops nasuta]|uniref:tryparedoxin-like n=1 Tax=Prorops nasuta TaxID=863751 RepID=UPI0034CE2EDE